MKFRHQVELFDSAVCPDDLGGSEHLRFSTVHSGHLPVEKVLFLVYICRHQMPRREFFWREPHHKSGTRTASWCATKVVSQSAMSNKCSTQIADFREAIEAKLKEAEGEANENGNGTAEASKLQKTEPPIVA